MVSCWHFLQKSKGGQEKKLRFFVENRRTKPRSHSLSDRRDRWDEQGQLGLPLCLLWPHFQPPQMSIIVPSRLVPFARKNKFTCHFLEMCVDVGVGVLLLLSSSRWKDIQMANSCKHPIGAHLCVGCIIKEGLSLFLGAFIHVPPRSCTDQYRTAVIFHLAAN